MSSQRVSGSTTSTEKVTYTYDENNVLEAINHNGFDYGFNYDEFGNTTSITVADRTLVTNVYAPNNGYLEEKVYGNGTKYEYTYDEYGRVTSVAVNGITKFNTVYNKKGQVAYIYDVANNRKLVYTYDISGRVLSLTYTGYATISTTYDDADRPNGVTYTFAGQEKSVSFTYEKGGQKGDAVLLSGVTRTTTYDELGRETSTGIGGLYRGINYTRGSVNGNENKTTTLPSQITYRQNGIVRFDESYTYDNIGNIKTVTNNGVTVTYSYDTLNQLTKASSTDGTVTKYFYNDGGNINYKVNADGSKTHYVYDAEWKDLLVEFDGKTITYDEIGNPISYLGNTMSWTGRQLDSITKADGTSISYTYDLDGIRTKKTVNGITTEYFVNGTTILAQKMGNDIIWFIYDVDGEILGFTYNDTPYYYIKNLQGDVVKIVDGMGVPVATYTYDPWGKITSTTGTLAEINPIRYRGYYYDNETGLYYLNSRYYDPETCRFVNADGQLSTGGDLTGTNIFAYCGNNPVNRLDSTGEAWWHWALGAAVVVACAVAVVVTAGGAAAAVAAVAAVGNGVAATTTATTVAAAAFIGSATVYGAAVYDAAITSSSVEEFNDKGDWDVVLSTIGGAVFNGALAYVGTKPQAPKTQSSSSVSNGACFVSGTAVLTVTGNAAIETVEAGDFVWASNPETGEVALKRVVQTFVNETTELVYITANGEEIICTNEHPFYSPVKGWIEACELRAGDMLVTVNGEYVVVEKVQHEILETPIKVYNFEVEGFHTYYVSECSILVHNTCGHTADQRAVIELAKEYKNGLSETDANTLVGWAKEYGLNYHYPMVHENRMGIWSIVEHVKVFKYHIPIIKW